MAPAKRKLKKYQLEYNRNFHRRHQRGNAKSKVGHYIQLFFQDGKAKKNPCGHTYGPSLVLDRPTRTFVIERFDMVERANTDHVRWVPDPVTYTRPRNELEATPGDLEAENREGPRWVVKNVVDHRTGGNHTVSLRDEWPGNYPDKWAPKKNIPKELISRYLMRRHQKYRELYASRDRSKQNL